MIATLKVDTRCTVTLYGKEFASPLATLSEFVEDIGETLDLDFVLMALVEGDVPRYIIRWNLHMLGNNFRIHVYCLFICLKICRSIGRN